MTASRAAAPGQDPPLDVFQAPLDGLQLIEASAGTGKTWAICGLVLRLLLERGLTVQQVLVVTFTEAATAELRERIRSRLAEVLAALPPTAPRPADPFITGLLGRLRQRPGLDDALLRERLEAALHGFDEAAIHTIHGWCQRALADTPFSAGLPMAQQVLLDDRALVDDAVRAAWREAVSRAPLPTALAAWLLAQRDSPAAWTPLLRRLLARPLAQRRWPAAIEGLDAPPEPGVDALQAAHAALAAHWAARRAEVVARVQAGLGQALNGSMYKAEGVQAGAAAWDDWLGSGDPLHTLDKDSRAKAWLYSRTKLVAATKKGQSTPQDPFFDEADALFELRTQAEQRLSLGRAWLMRRVLERAEAALRQHKRREGLVAFDDMLFNLHQALHDPARPERSAALATALRERHPAALIDEFQDTDPLQFAIFRRLYPPAADAPGEARAHGTLFLVGDPKQAIYSFRNADLPTYLAARALADGAHCLAHNQRSVPALVAGLNRLFGQHPQAFMEPGLAYQPVGVGPKRRSVLVDHSAAGAAAHAALQLWPLPATQADGEPPNREEAIAMALQATAAEIARLLGEARHARLTLDGRPLRAGDIAVLVRRHREGAAMRQALAARGIGSVELSQASVFHSAEAEDLAYLLRALLQPGREPWLRAALATELLGRSAAELDAAARRPEGLADEAQRLADHAQRWRERGIAVCLRRMLADEGIATRLLRLPQGERRLTNWLHLAETLHEAEASHRAPTALLRWFDAQRRDEAVTDAAQLRLESDQNLVQIVTVHKSKGLEYPVVFCPVLWLPGRAWRRREAILSYPEAGAEGSVRVLDFRAGIDPDIDDQPLHALIAREAMAEDLRLIYVALTRAVHRCALVVGAPARQARDGRRFQQSDMATPLNWLVAGDGQTTEDWVAAKTALTPDALRQAWATLAHGHGATPPGPPPVALRPFDEVLAAAGAQPPAPAHELPPPQALPPPARIPAGWSIGSYSQLTRSTPAADTLADATLTDAGDLLALDHDAAADAPAVAPPAAGDAPSPTPADTARAPILAADDILRFPRGGAAGECIHRVFEQADFQQPAPWPAVIEAALDGLPGSEPPERAPRAAMLHRMLREVCRQPLLPEAPGAPGLRLADLPMQRRWVELEFHLPAPQLSASALQALLDAHGYPVPPLAFGHLQGWLRGFIDLVFEHAGRWYVLDWKSNHLGFTPADYRPAACRREMAAQGYHLQALLYALALHRLLRLRLAGYDPARHLGGVAYVFVRGFRPGWADADGAPCGLHLDQPSTALLDALDRLFRGPTSPHGPTR